MNATVLVIEDNLEMCENISEILKMDNYNVVTAVNGKTGIELARKHKPDLVLCDIMMPELDGYGVLHILSKHPETSDIPFIFLTAKAEKNDFRKGMNLGADDYIIKPFDGMELLTAVEIRLKKNEQLKATFGTDPQDIDAFFKTTSQLNDFSGLSESRPNKVFKKKDFIFREGEQPGLLYYIIRGEVKTCRSNQEGKELVTGILRKGNFVGYVPLLQNSQYTESAVALTDTELKTIPKEDFNTLIYTNRLVAARFIKILSNSLYQNERRLLDLAYQSVRQRVAAAIVDLLHQQNITENKDGLINLARRDIAAIVGTALESLNRTIADFKEEGLIEIKDSGIKIINPGKLERLSH